MKILLVTDTHLGINKSSELYHNVVYTLFEEIYKTCLEKNIRHIVHLGDFFHNRKELNTKTQAVAHKIAKLFTDDLVWLILGNHDCYYKDRLHPTPAELFEQYSNWRVLDEPTAILDDIVLCPYNTIPVGFRGGYCMGHFEFVGFKMNSSYVCEKGQSPEDIAPNDFKHIYSGHFHTPSTKNNITYLGSPYQQTFHDIDNKLGYHIFEDGELEFIEFTSAPKFKIVKTDSFDEKEIKGNIVKLVYTEDYGTMKNQEIIDIVLGCGPVRLQTDFSNVKIEGTDEKLEESDASLLDHDEIITDYINKTEVPERIKKKTLLGMIEKLRRENGE
jgi:DNA repair exonuclease SbcCD nuclease subunit